MTSLKRLLLAVLAAAALSLIGCTSQTDTSIPWSRPASWEAQVPGMGSGQGLGR